MASKIVEKAKGGNEKGVMGKHWFSAKGGKTKTGMRHKGQNYDMHSSDYVGETKMTRPEIKKKWASIVGKH